MEKKMSNRTAPVEITMGTESTIREIDFAEQTPKQQISQVTPDELYKKAWLENESSILCEYCMNTTAWD